MSTWTVTEPCVVDGMPDDVYHADPVPAGSLSASGAKLLLPPSCPARYAWYRQHGRPPKAEFDLGHAAHLLALGAGPELEVVDAADWRTKAAREQRDKAREAGRVPVLERQWVEVQGMASVLREHPIAGELLNPGTMRPEVSVFWRDPWHPTVMRRARLDAISQPDADGGQIIVDYKTCDKADPDSISRAMWNYGYALQAAWYMEAAAAALPERLIACDRFLFVFQEKTPPYVVTVAEPSPDALRVGEKLAGEAVGLYAAYSQTNHWPGYVPEDEIPLIGLPPWVERQYPTDEEEVIW